MKPKSMNADFFFETIDRLYAEEAIGEHHESKFKTVTFNFPVEDASMLSAIAKRFGRSNASFGGDVFAEGVSMLFLALSPEDRHKLAVEADADSTVYLRSKGWEVKDSKGKIQERFEHWVKYAAIYDDVNSEAANNE